MTRTATTRSWSSTRSGALAAVVLAVGLLAGCSGGGGGDSSAATAPQAGGGEVQQRDGAQAESGGAGSPATGGVDKSGQPASGAGAALTQRREIRTAQMSVRATDVTAAAGKLRQIVAAEKGFVSDEKTSNGDDYSESTLTVRVPASSLDRVMERVGETGKVLSRSQAAEDVTSRYVDTESRLRSQRASVERVRALLVRAKDIGQVVTIESELARRQADLESLEAQLEQLRDSTTLSTLTVSLTPTATARPVDDDDQGFLTGLQAGWRALTASLTVGLTVVGALLPFMVVGAIVLVPVLVLARRRRRSALAPAGPVAPPATS